MAHRCRAAGSCGLRCLRQDEGSRGRQSRDAEVLAVAVSAPALHRDDGFGSGAGVTPSYTDAVRGCHFVDLSVDAGVAAGRAGT